MNIPHTRTMRPTRRFVEDLERRVLLSAMPNDPYYPYQWGLGASGAASAWSYSTGSAATVVGHLDSGIDYTHPDLYENIWINQDEIPKSLQGRLHDVDGDGIITFRDLNHSLNARFVQDVNGNGYIDAGDLLAPRNADGSGGWADGVDGGGNGYVDDIIGWDFVNNHNDPRDLLGHGTHTAGILGAMGNNGIGISGVAWDVSMMAVKIFDHAGNSATSNAIADAIRYVVDQGARVSNNSWGGTLSRGTQAVYDAVNYANDNGHVFVVAAGNNGINNDTSFWRSYPASFNLPNVISVAASNPAGGLAHFSNYGRTTVDLAAPGVNILSTWLDGGYAFMSGTSMAAPHVTGTVALMLAQDPNLSVGQIESALTSGVQQTIRLLSASSSGGTLGAGHALVHASLMNTSATSAAGQTLGRMGVIDLAGPDSDVLTGSYARRPGAFA